MNKIKVNLRPLVRRLNLPTVIKTAILPGESEESLFIATQVGEIFVLKNNTINTFLNIRRNIIKLNGYDERGLLGLAFHPNFSSNGLFYLHYSVAGTQGPGALSEAFVPNPCNPETLNLKWTNRTQQFDHIDTVEEWIYEQKGSPRRLRIILNLRRPFLNHNGVNSLNFSPESEKLVLTTGDGGSGFDPFNLSQDNMEVAGKIIEIDVDKKMTVEKAPAVTRFDEIPQRSQEILAVTVKGVRNIPGITFQKINNNYMKYVGNVGQELVESIFAFSNYHPIPVTQLIKGTEEPLINLGWRGWEGAFPTMFNNNCAENSTVKRKIMAYYENTVETVFQRIRPLTSYFHEDSRPNKFAGTALTGVQVYKGTEIPSLTGNIIFTDLARKSREQAPTRGVLATTKFTPDKLSDYHAIDINYNFGDNDAYFVSLGTNMDQTRLFLGVYHSMMVSNLHQGIVFEVVP